MLATLQLAACSSQPAASGQPRRVAITTFWDGSLSYECAIPLWCQSAARLSAVLPEALAPEVVLIAPRPSAECPAAKRLVWDPETAAASRQYVQRMSRTRRATRTGGANMESFLKDAVLLKWTVWTMLDFDLVLFSDLDIDARPLVDSSRPEASANYSRPPARPASARSSAGRPLSLGQPRPIGRLACFPHSCCPPAPTTSRSASTGSARLTHSWHRRRCTCLRPTTPHRPTPASG